MEIAQAATPDSRLVSLDVFRGITVAFMILVTDPGTYSAVYWPLRHADWEGATPTDMIFPSFLFIVGVSIPLAFASRIERGESRTKLAWHALRRCVLLVLLGLAVNGFPNYDWQNLRLPGILQRIGVCYLCAALLYMGTNPRRRAAILTTLVAAILAGYWALLKLVPVPCIGAGHLDSYGNLPAYIDRAVFGTKHLWAYGLTPGRGVTYDPEGILSTLPAFAGVLIGILAGEWMRSKDSSRRKVLGLAAAGLALLLAGWLLSPLLPINKRIYTTTFALLSSGVSLLLFVFFYAVVDLRSSRQWTTPALVPVLVASLVFGTNAILAFALSSVITGLSDRLHLPGNPANLHHWGYEHLFATWLQPIHASLAYAITIVLLNLAILYPFYRRRIFLKL